MGLYMTIDERGTRLTALEVDLGRLIRLVDGENGGEINPGIVGVLRRTSDQTDANSQKISNIERAIDRAKWTFAGFAATGGLLGGGMVYLITQVVEGNMPTP